MKIQEITTDQIQRAYRGKQSPGKSCRCGCDGKYYPADASEPDAADALMTVKILRTIQANEELAEIDGNIVDLILGSGQRKDVFTVYLKEATLAEQAREAGQRAAADFDAACAAHDALQAQ